MAKQIKAKEIKKKEYNECPPLSEELRKKNFPNNPPPTLKQIKAIKNKRLWDSNKK